MVQLLMFLSLEIEKPGKEIYMKFSILKCSKWPGLIHVSLYNFLLVFFAPQRRFLKFLKKNSVILFEVLSDT